jgi:D-alanyl-D-alanine carboxypeptidase/D-alanyl-D-alanine carboxypeptidase (penicillin-binding protein 5/6)
MKHEEFRRIVSTKKKTVTNSDGESRLIINHNKLLSLYDGAIGIKTGFTRKSGRCLVGAAEKDGITLISVTIDAPDDWNDHTSLFNYGYSVLKAESIKPGDFSYEIPIFASESTLTVSNTESFTYILKKDGVKIKTIVQLPRYALPPIKEGEKLGEVILLLNNREIARIPLVISFNTDS